jgi:hypothetical protein
VIAFPLLIVWILVAIGALRFEVDIIKEDPSEMPGGGPWVVVLLAFLWPLIAVFAAIALLVVGVEELFGGKPR